MAELAWTVPATVRRVIDGDTVIVDLDLGWRVYRQSEHLRVAGINAPERGTRAGRSAKDYADELLPEGTRVLVTSTAKPSFERTVGTIAIPGRGEFADLMVEAGHATPAESARKRPAARATRRRRTPTSRQRRSP